MRIMRADPLNANLHSEINRAKTVKRPRAVRRSSNAKAVSPHTRLLLVDDDFDAVEALSDLLTYRGYEVAAAYNGLQALQSLALPPLPDVLILDLSMPFMNGWELMRELGKNHDLAVIPVIVVSGLAPAAGVNLQANAVLSKPLDVEALLSVIGKLRKA